MKLGEWFRVLWESTKPRNPEKEFGTEDTVKAFEAVQQEAKDARSR